jgi:hypothetical protein
MRFSRPPNAKAPGLGGSVMITPQSFRAAVVRHATGFGGRHGDYRTLFIGSGGGAAGGAAAGSGPSVSENTDPGRYTRAAPSGLR